jgi:hypothetical protein
MSYKGTVLLSLIDDKHNVIPSITPEGCTIIAAPPEMIRAFDQYVVDARSFHKVIEGYTNLFHSIVAFEREAIKDYPDHVRFDGILLRNRNINSSVIYYLTSKLKEAGYRLVFSEQKRLAKSSPAEYVPSYFITFDF